MRGTRAKAERKAGKRKGPAVRDKADVNHDIPWTTRELEWRQRHAKVRLAPEPEHGKLKPVVVKDLEPVERFESWVASLHDRDALATRLNSQSKDFLTQLCRDLGMHVVEARGVTKSVMITALLDRSSRG